MLIGPGAEQGHPLHREQEEEEEEETGVLLFHVRATSLPQTPTMPTVLHLLKAPTPHGSVVVETKPVPDGIMGYLRSK